MEPRPTVPEVTPRHRQLRLFAMENPLGTRLGADFFRRLPAKPGVYFFHDALGALLYIGQSCDLRARVGSYRHVSPEQHPKRTLRLVHRVARIECRECGTHAEAQELERVLLLEKRPPFNRAGIWPGYAWWLTLAPFEDRVEARLSREPLPQAGGIGPLPSAFRHAHGSLMRCTYRLLHPDQKLADYPLGLLNRAIPLHVVLRTRDAASVASQLAAFAMGSGADYLAQLHAILGDAPPLELEFWTGELDALQRFAAKPKPLPLPTPPTLRFVSLPLFPEW
jgi:hypothetical protein